jgi:arylformamidase
MLRSLVSMVMITDWDDAYANGKYIEGGDSFPAKWMAAAQAYRDLLSAQGRARLDVRYGPGPRQILDLFLPLSKPRGLAVFVHGGYWLAFDKSSWSHLARGAVEAGWAAALPSYRLAPEASVAMITRDVAQAVSHVASMIAGPIRLAGHSAGGHLVTRLACRNSPLGETVQHRIERVLSVSGVHDLRPLQRTAMADKLFASPSEAEIESPALLEPVPGTRLVCWVGGNERPELLRQTDLLANIWHGLGAETQAVHEDNKHHFNIIDGLTSTDSPLARTFLGD